MLPFLPFMTLWFCFYFFFLEPVSKIYPKAPVQAQALVIQQAIVVLTYPPLLPLSLPVSPFKILLFYKP